MPWLALDWCPRSRPSTPRDGAGRRPGPISFGPIGLRISHGHRTDQDEGTMSRGFLRGLGLKYPGHAEEAFGVRPTRRGLLGPRRPVLVLCRAASRVAGPGPGGVGWHSPAI